MQNCATPHETEATVSGSSRNVINVPYNTMATASLSTLSPKQFEYRLKSTLSALKMASTVTGSVAEIKAPNTRHSVIEMCCASVKNHERTSHNPTPTTAVLITVPIKANARILTMFLKNMTCIMCIASVCHGCNQSSS